MNSFVYCLGIHSAVQRTLVFNTFRRGEVNRAVARQLSGAGKSINTAAALERLGVRARAAAFNGGRDGRWMAAWLRTSGIRCCLTPMAGTIRTCTTILDRGAGTATELVEEGPAVTAAERRAFTRSGVRHAAACRLLAVSGTLPADFPVSFYRSFVNAATRAGRPAVIDSHGAALRAVLPLRPLLAKMNVRELAATYALPCNTEAQVCRLAGSVLDEGARWVLVTHGAAAAVLLGPEGSVWRLTPPAIDPMNPIGSGDCVTAGLIRGWLDGRSMPEAAVLGLACGTANALTPVPADFRVSDVRRLAGLIRVETIHAR